jgi:hypothetical protein
MTRTASRITRRKAAALKQSTPASKVATGVNGHALDLASLFPLAMSPGYYNPAARAALLRRRKRGPHDELVVDFQGPQIGVELRAADRPLLLGAWHWQATFDGQPLEPAGPWEESCWHTDDDCDYLELELPLAGDWRLERQMLLARGDRFLLLADALLAPANTLAGDIHYELSLPLAPGMQFAPAGETREGHLMAGKRKAATVLPLALPEWRAEFSHASLATKDGQLTLRQAAAGRNLYAPLWIDLDPARARQPLTWRRLTVAENLQIVPRETAVGYRVQFAARQWLLYRSLAGWGNRTVLGQNYSSEFVCSRFLRSGKTEDILGIEPAD